MKEAQTMRQLHHTNVLALHVSFVQKQQLWMVEPYVAGGSMLNIMKYAYREVGPGHNQNANVSPCLRPRSTS